MTTNIDDDPNLIWDKATKCIKKYSKGGSRRIKMDKNIRKKNLIVERGNSSCH